MPWRNTTTGPAIAPERPVNGSCITSCWKRSAGRSRSIAQAHLGSRLLSRRSNECSRMDDPVAFAHADTLIRRDAAQLLHPAARPMDFEFVDFCRRSQAEMQPEVALRG